MTDPAQQPQDAPEGACAFPRIPDKVDVDPLLLAVIHALVFLQGSSEDVVDPQAADEAVDHMVSYLQRLQGKDLERMKTGLKNLGQFARQQKWKPDEVAFLDEFMDVLGLT